MEMYIAKFEKEDNKTVLYVPVYANTEMEAKKPMYILKAHRVRERLRFSI